MPTWIDTPQGPVYVDEAGNPTTPPDSAFSPVPDVAFGPTNELGIELEQGGAGGEAGVDIPSPLPFAEKLLSGVGGAVTGAFTAPPLPTAESTKTGEGQSVAVSKSGYSPAAFEATSTGVKALDKANAAARRKAEAQGAISAAPYVEASAIEEGATTRATEAKVGKSEATRKGEETLSKLQDTFAKLEQESAAVAKQASDDAFGRYKQSVMENAVTVDPNHLFDGLSGVGKGGAILTAFVHDFLGAKGIKTSGLASIKEAIDRDIQIQIENIKNGREVSEQFRQIWAMQVAESATEAEARERVRGFQLASVEKAIAAEVSKYDSELARAQGEAAIAAIRREMANTFLSIQQMTEESYQAEVRNNLAVWQTRVQAAHQSASLKLQRDQLEEQKLARKMAANSAMAEKLNDRVVTDPATGQIKFKGRTKEEAAKLREGAAAYQSLQQNMRQLREMNAEAVTYGGWGNAMVNSQFSKRAMALQTELAYNWAVAKNGGRLSDQDFNVAKGFIPLNTTTYRGTGEDVINDMMVRAYDGFNDKARAQGEELSPVDQALIDAGMIGAGVPADFAKPEVDEARSQLTGQDEEKPTPVGAAVKRSATPGKPSTEVTSGKVTGVEGFTAEDLEALYTSGGLGIPLDVAVEGAKDAEGNLLPPSKQKEGTKFLPPDWAIELDRAVDAVEAAAPEAREKLLNEAITKLSVIATGYDAKNADEALRNVADPEKNTASELWDPAKAAYAEYLIYNRLAPLVNAGPVSTPE